MFILFIIMVIHERISRLTVTFDDGGPIIPQILYTITLTNLWATKKFDRGDEKKFLSEKLLVVLKPFFNGRKISLGEKKTTNLQMRRKMKNPLNFHEQTKRLELPCF